MKPVAGIGLAATLAACVGAPPDRASTLGSAAAFVATIPGALHARGPLAWNELAAPDDFRMFSDGVEKFASAGALAAAMTPFASQVRSMNLRWDAHTEPLGTDAAWFTASYDETIVHTDGTNSKFAGCVTGLLRPGDDGWHITRLHWSHPR